MFREALYEEGWSIIENVYTIDEIIAMRRRITEICQGKHWISERRFNVESKSGRYEDIDSEVTEYQGNKADYRKVSHLFEDELISELLQKDFLVSHLSELMPEGAAVMRATVMDKSGDGGTVLPWHQDRFVHWPNSQDPVIGLWFPLDELKENSGTLEVIPRAYKEGRLGDGHIIEPKVIDRLKSEYGTKKLVVALGNVAVFMSGTPHMSGRNYNSKNRRAVNVILLPKNTFNRNTGIEYVEYF